MKLQINHVGKRFKNNTWGVRDFSLELNSGILGLLGAKGVGKTTLLRMLATITKPTCGTISWNGVDIVTSPNELRAHLGYLPQGFGVFPNLTAWDFLKQVAAMKGMKMKMAEKRIQQLLEQFELTQHRHKVLSELSASVRQRIGIVQALINDPQLLILDEPASGLTNEQWEHLRTVLTQLSHDRIIIIATAKACEVADLATEVAVISQGELLVQGQPEELAEMQYVQSC